MKMTLSNHDDRSERQELRSLTVKASPSKQFSSKENLEKCRDTNQANTDLPNNSVSNDKRKDTSLPNKQVSQVIAKTKKAASSLWIILHAQTCKLDPLRCPHRGCTEAKQVLLHLKSCTARNCEKCPQNYNGCLQSRKLLTHYRRCKETRSKQVGRIQSNPCLLCALVARHAKTAYENGKNKSPPYCVSIKAKSATKLRTQSTAQLIKPMVSENKLEMKALQNQKNEFKRFSSTELMPPPPQRPPLGESKFEKNSKGMPARTQSLLGRTPLHSTYGSPPTNNELMQKGIREVAKVADPFISSAGNMLGKSFDSVRGSFLSQKHSSSPYVVRSPALPLLDRNQMYHRRRSSFDETSACRGESKSSYMEYTDGGNDPTVELMLKSQETRVVPTASKLQSSRLRSSSCSLLSSLNKSGFCETIFEEDLHGEHSGSFHKYSMGEK